MARPGCSTHRRGCGPGRRDGIVLHHLLQRHHVVSHVDAYPTDTVAGLQVNALADGFFHAVTWLVVLAGSITMLEAWRDGRVAPSCPSTSVWC